MEKRFIGIDIDGRTLRVAIARPDKGGPTLVKVAKARLDAPEALPAALADIIGATRIYGDRLAAALPASAAFYRWVQLPFSDPKRLAAAGRLNLAAQLPINIDGCVLAFLPPVTGEQGTTTAMAAVPTPRIAEFLAPFDQSDTALHLLDLIPFAVSRGVSGTLKDAVVLLLREEESVACLLRDGNLADCRLLPATAQHDGAREAERLAQACAGLGARAGACDLPLVAMGPGATDALLAELSRLGCRLASPEWTSQGTKPAAEYLPAAALAIRASLTDRQGRSNLRQGEFALRGEWAALKKHLAIGGALLTLCLILLTGTAWLHHAHKAATVDALQEQMRELYRRTFPDDKLTRDPHRQMLGRIGRIKEEGRMLGLLRSHSALDILRQISDATPEDLVLDTRELRYEKDGLTLDGTTDTFDSVNRLARALEQAPLFAQAQVADAKQSADGSRIDFRLQITLSQEESS